MDFLVDFSELFSEKHGKKVYDEICNKIKLEAPVKYDDNYAKMIFKIALVGFWGMTDDKIQKFLKDTDNIEVDVKNIKNVHKNSITEIQKYLENAGKDKNNR